MFWTVSCCPYRTSYTVPAWLAKKSRNRNFVMIRVTKQEDFFCFSNLLSSLLCYLLIVGRERRMGTDCMMGKRIHKCIRYMYVLFFKKSCKKTTFSKPTEKRKSEIGKPKIWGLYSNYKEIRQEIGSEQRQNMSGRVKTRQKT